MNLAISVFAVIALAALVSALWVGNIGSPMLRNELRIETSIWAVLVFIVAMAVVLCLLIAKAIN